MKGKERKEKIAREKVRLLEREWLKCVFCNCSHEQNTNRLSINRAAFCCTTTTGKTVAAEDEIVPL